MLLMKAQFTYTVAAAVALTLCGCNRSSQSAGGPLPATSGTNAAAPVQPGNMPTNFNSPQQQQQADQKPLPFNGQARQEPYRQQPNAQPFNSQDARQGNSGGRIDTQPQYSQQQNSQRQNSQQQGRAVATIPPGTAMQVRLEQSVDTKHNGPGDKFQASLASPLTVDGIVIPVGTRMSGHLTESKSSGRLKGRAIIGLELDSMQFNGASYPLSTAVDTKVGARHRGRNIGWIGGMAGAGALIGGVAAGPMGALAGAGAGAGAGTAGAYFTGKKDIRLPAETLLTFRLRSAVPLR